MTTNEERIEYLKQQIKGWEDDIVKTESMASNAEKLKTVQDLRDKISAAQLEIAAPSEKP